SAQVIAAARGAPASVTGKRLCIAPLRLKPAGGALRLVTSELSVADAVCQTAAGSCSVPPGRGDCVPLALVELAAIWPSGRVANALQVVVPRSRPITTLIFLSLAGTFYLVIG